MLGAIIGDIAGSRFEFDNHRDKAFEMFTNECFFTDDTVMTLAIAKAIKNCDGDLERLSDETVRCMQEIGRHYPHCGYGGRFVKWMFCDEPKPYGSYGNGAAMRVSPCGFFAQTEDAAKALSRAVTAVTHDHPEGIKGAEATTVAIFLAKNGATKQEIRDRIEAEYYPLRFTLDELREKYAFNETCQGTVPQAIEAFLESTSFEDAIRNAISIGGDSDTLAAITGGIAEAYYGIDKTIERAALHYLDDALRGICAEWKAFIRPFYPPKKFMMLTKYLGKLTQPKAIRAFEEETYLFAMQHPEYDLSKYEDALKAKGLQWNEASMQSADVQALDAKTVLALIVGACRADHFCEGLLRDWCVKGVVDPWLARLNKIDDAQRPEPEPFQMTSLRMTIQSDEQTATLQLTPSELVISENAKDAVEISHCYKRTGNAIPFLFDPIFEAMEALLCADGWQEDDKALLTDSFRFTLTAGYADGSQQERAGVFDRAHMPEAEWMAAAAALRRFLGSFDFGAILSMRGFMRAMRPGEVKYCGVEFSAGGKLYHYRTTDLLIEIGDEVVVLVGDENYEKVATVRTIEFCRWDDTPYPLEKTKEILCKTDEMILREIALLEDGEDDE